ncbi:MAG: CapA family protein, partial [Atribacterota bacterium]|nr:CapA family protein [Atribacterota bacterium]
MTNEIFRKELSVEILIAGDLVPTNSNMNLFKNADVKNLLGKELLSLWNSSDARIFNLEAPLVDTENPIDKFGPNLIVPTETIKGIKGLNPTLITLANNHILDQMEQGLFSTQSILNEAGIPFIGAGKNLYEASKPFIIKKDGYKIGI